MCFDLDSRPPIEPIAGGALDSGTVTLSGEDGTSFRAFAARPADASGAGILILPDVRGLHAFYEELALRFAEHGVAAVAIDYFGRTAGVGPRPADFDHQPHVAATQWANLQGDIRAGVAHLRSDALGAPRAAFATGFCMGGRLASVAATLGLDLAGVIPFYGWPVGPHKAGTPAPAEVADQIECPVLAIYGGADQGIGADARDAYDKALTDAGIDVKTIVYPGAPHGFFDRKHAEFADASADAWAATTDFIADRTS